MNLINRLAACYVEAKGNKWFRYFATFCRIGVALAFVPSGFVKVSGERFTALPSNHPLGHYFDALHLTGYYYTFIGAGQLITAALLLIPRTAVLGALMAFPIMLNITVLVHATRFEGTRIVTLILLANIFLLCWYFDRVRYILPFKCAELGIPEYKPLNNKFPFAFFGMVIAIVATVIIGNMYLYNIRPGNSELECTNGCGGPNGDPACNQFCDCIYNRGMPLDTCLKIYEKASKNR
ncbi:DoxX protein [Dyadobacter sp. SG02]|uniref:DoxX family membrane protein n=1 Tax=Dyadobacter sp. SG02 TaxID=1855291 RepID=UPI0008AE812F|nr:DoxX family membrane protein [Dyadobacter sp. SG02]SEI57082.1 DoxX protein [Dyadobacter sp. SG02]